MITTQEFYGLECNNCKKDYEGSDGIAYYYDSSDTLNIAEENGWHEHPTISDTHFCNDCFMGVLFDKWMDDLKEIAVKDFAYSPETVFDRDAWHDYYIDDISPEEALTEDAAHGEN